VAIVFDRSEQLLVLAREHHMLEPYALSFANHARTDAPRVGILPVPYDRTASYASGARNGPDAILLASRQLESYDELLRLDPTRAGIATYAALEPHAEGPRAMLDAVRDAVAALCATQQIPVLLGGDHSLTIGAVEAVSAAVPDLGVLQIDAHADMRAAYEGSRYSHACVMRRVRERVEAVSIGVRSYSEEEAQYMREATVAVHSPRDLRGVEDPGALLGALPANVYVTIDVDGFDPSIMPATGTPEPGGLSWEDVDAVLAWTARHRRIVGFDVVELAPIAGLHAPDYLAARLVHRTIGRALSARAGA
jgi:agmatinase